MPTPLGALKGIGLVSAILVACSSVLLYHVSILPQYQMSAVDPRVTRFQRHDLDAFAGFDFDAATERLAAALRIKTVSLQAREVVSGPGFVALRQLYERSYPLVHKTLTREIISDYSLLFRWRGSLAVGGDDVASWGNGRDRPYLLMSHMDVVPAANDTLRDWQSEPFAGHILDGFLYGRGAIDVKQGVSSLLEAVERLLQQGYQPRRTLYLFFGHDEETGGHNGVQVAARLLEERGVRLDFVVDEGGMITQGVVPVTPKPVALIGIGEKGYLSVDLELRGTGGHSSMPPSPTPIGELTAALQALERYQMPSTLRASGHLLDFLAPELPFVARLAVANKALFEPLLISQLGSSPSGNAVLRTTTAPTMLSAAAKDNVLPAVVKATVNFRVLPGDSLADVVAHVKEVIANPRINVTVWESSAQEATALSDPHSPQFGLLQATLKQLRPDVLVAPYLMIGATDSRFLSNVCDNIFRFIPYFNTPSDLPRYHGINERISLSDIQLIIRWQYQLIRNADAS